MVISYLLRRLNTQLRAVRTGVMVMNYLLSGLNPYPRAFLKKGPQLERRAFCLAMEVAGGLDWWFGFGFEPLALVEGRWENRDPTNHRDPNHQSEGTVGVPGSKLVIG